MQFKLAVPLPTPKQMSLPLLPSLRFGYETARQCHPQTLATIARV
jgi:hypothetical protein